MVGSLLMAGAWRIAPSTVAGEMPCRSRTSLRCSLIRSGGLFFTSAAARRIASSATVMGPQARRARWCRPAAARPPPIWQVDRSRGHGMAARHAGCNAG